MPRLSLPAAIVIAGALVGVGVFAGLRSRVSAPSPIPVFGTTTAVRGGQPSASDPSPPSGAPVGAPAGGTAPLSLSPLEKEVVRRIEDALEKQRPALLKKCWENRSARSAEVKSARWVFGYTIGAEGQQLGRGTGEQGGSGEITSCVLGALQPLLISPPGQIVEVQVPFELP